MIGPELQQNAPGQMSTQLRCASATQHNAALVPVIGLQRRDSLDGSEEQRELAYAGRIDDRIAAESRLDQSVARSEEDAIPHTLQVCRKGHASVG